MTTSTTTFPPPYPPPGPSSHAAGIATIIIAILGKVFIRKRLAFVVKYDKKMQTQRKLQISNVLKN
jgi:hypothetical protein